MCVADVYEQPSLQSHSFRVLSIRCDDLDDYLRKVSLIYFLNFSFCFLESLQRLGVLKTNVLYIYKIKSLNVTGLFVTDREKTVKIGILLYLLVCLSF